MAVSGPNLTGESSLVSSKQPQCVKSHGSAGADEAKGFFGFLLFSSPPPLELHPGCFSAVVLISCLYKHPNWNLPPSLETLPGSNLELTVSPRVLTPSSASSSHKGGATSGTGRILWWQGTSKCGDYIKYKLWGLLWFC